MALDAKKKQQCEWFDQILQLEEYMFLALYYSNGNKMLQELYSTIIYLNSLAADIRGSGSNPVRTHQKRHLLGQKN